MLAKENLRNITKEKRWPSEIHKLLAAEKVSDECSAMFHSYWTESGHRIREQISDDQLVVKMLWKFLPVYRGESRILFRGENIDRWKQNEIGFSWTASKEVASMFARGLNSFKTGGLLLSCACNPEWIISEPNKHSEYLGESEFTVDPFKLKNIKVLSEYQPSEIFQNEAGAP